MAFRHAITGLFRDNRGIAEAVDVLKTLQPRKAASPLIRIGGDGDGGYLVPDDLEGIAACFSPGVADTANFELNLSLRGIPSYMADASVAAPPVSNELFHFRPKYLGAQNSGDYITLESWIDECAPPGDLLLQMDIEGAEYEVLLATRPEYLRRFRIVVLELHWLHRLFDRFPRRLIRAALQKLTHDFHVVHAHPNNAARIVVRGGVSIPRVLEITLLRKDRGVLREFATEFPHPLDRDNVPTRRSRGLPRSLIGG